ncbi:MAG: hypothetical protein ACI84R_002912 [Candidatus Azotimanducaceae bacterium]|jgi:hypothetical protein
MKQVIEKENPVGSFIAEQAQLTGYYTDCFSIRLDQTVTLPEFINAFYTTPLFRLERLLLSLTVKGRMKDADVTALSRGEADRLAIWQVEVRNECEILLSAGRTKSWLMVAPDAGGTDETQLFFGSVVVPEPPKREGDAPRLGPVFDSLLSAHQIYSRLLLSSAAQRLS